MLSPKHPEVERLASFMPFDVFYIYDKAREAQAFSIYGIHQPEFWEQVQAVLEFDHSFNGRYKVNESIQNFLNKTPFTVEGLKEALENAEYSRTSIYYHDAPKWWQLRRRFRYWMHKRRFK